MNEHSHFINLAIQGKRPGASSGEHRARKLAECIVENAPGLDVEATQGLIEFIFLAQEKPSSCRDLLE